MHSLIPTQISSIFSSSLPPIVKPGKEIAEKGLHTSIHRSDSHGYGHFDPTKYIHNFGFEQRYRNYDNLTALRSIKSRNRKQAVGSCQRTENIKLISLNIDGDGKNLADMSLRMKGWKSKRKVKNADLILLQETHLSSKTQAANLDRLWRSVWGIPLHNREGPYTWWSCGSSSSAGVGILLNPRSSLKGVKLLRDITTRLICVWTPIATVYCVYAPTAKLDREHFFKDLDKMCTLDSNDFLIMGDFNCCLQPLIDRQYKFNRSAKSESLALDQLVEKYSLTDSIHLLQDSKSSTAENWADNKQEHHTYFKANISSRIDRCYISRGMRSIFGQLFVDSSPVKSDHKELHVILRDPADIPTSLLESKIYPVKVRNAKLLQYAIKQALTTISDYMAKFTNKVIVWEIGKILIANLISKVRTHDRKQQKFLSKLRMQRLHKLLGDQRIPRDIMQRTLMTEQSVREAAQLLRNMNLDKYKAMSNTYSTKVFYERYKAPKYYKLVTTINGPYIDRPDSASRNMANEWRKIFATRFSSRRKASNYQQCDFQKIFHAIQPIVPPNLNATLTEPMKFHEIELAIKKMVKNKTAGPDLLANEFYKDYHDQLIPILEQVFNYSLIMLELPPSFQVARIYPQKKSGDSMNGLDYRPISCLNGDYKLFTRVLAERLKRVLSVIIHSNQHGGLPRRTLNSALYKTQAVLHQMYNDESEHPEDAPALAFLDIKKAYDTLERSFLFRALQKFGFTDKFTNLIKCLHTNTQAYFVLNGFSSHLIPQTRGIRQGCPIAPLLFIVAIEVLLCNVRMSQKLEGILLRNNTTEIPVKALSFIDDTVIFLKQLRNVRHLQFLLTSFEGNSGLAIQQQKTKCLLLNRTSNLSTTNGFQVRQYVSKKSQNTKITYRGYRMLDKSDYIRYLGVRLGYFNVSAYNWTLFKTNLYSKLAIWSSKSSNYVSRRQLLRVNVGASFAFLAQYFLPDARVIRDLQGILLQMFWKGFVKKTVDGVKLRNSSSKDILLLPCSLGGLGILDLQYEIVKVAIRSIIRWITLPFCLEKHAINVMIQQSTRLTQAIIPLDISSNAMLNRGRSEKSIWSLGVRYITYLNDYQSLLQRFLIKRKAMSDWYWTCPISIQQSGETMKWSIPYYDQVQWDKHRQDINAFVHVNLKQFILRTPLTQNKFVLDERLMMISAPALKQVSFYDMFTVRTWNKYSGEVIITKKSRLNKKLLKMMIYYALDDVIDHVAFPMLYAGIDILHPTVRYNMQRDAVELSANCEQLTGTYRNFSSPVCFDNGYNKSLHSYIPACYPYVAMYYDESRFINYGKLKDGQRVKKTIKFFMRASHQLLYKKSRTLLAERHDRWNKRHGKLHNALLQVHLHKSARTRLHSLGIENFWLKLKFFMHKMWYPDAHAQENCYISDCYQLKSNNITHILMECSRAIYVQDKLLHWWMGHSNNNLQHWHDAIITGIPLQLPLRLIAHCSQTLFWKHHPDTVINNCKQIWRIASETMLWQLWIHRNNFIFKQEVLEHQHAWNLIRKAIDSSLAAIKAQKKHTRQLMAKQIYDIYTNERITINPPLTTPKVAFGWFDGGHRLKSDRSASGAIIYQLTERGLRLLDYKSTYLGKNHTNNLAEYGALVDLCILATKHAISTVHIRGDSKMITDQVMNLHNCRTYKLARLRNRALSALSSIQYTIQHVKREWNTMADFLANLANDTETTASLIDLQDNLDLNRKIRKFLAQDTSHAKFPASIKLPPEIDKHS